MRRDARAHVDHRRRGRRRRRHRVRRAARAGGRTWCRSCPTPTTRRSTAPSPRGARRRARHSPYFVHDADPLARGRRRLGAPLRRATGRSASSRSRWPRRWRAGGSVRSSSPTTTWCSTPRRGRRPARHWYLGVLHTAAPARVVPVPDPGRRRAHAPAPAARALVARSRRAARRDRAGRAGSAGAGVGGSRYSCAMFDELGALGPERRAGGAGGPVPVLGDDDLGLPRSSDSGL